MGRRRNGHRKVAGFFAACHHVTVQKLSVPSPGLARAALHWRRSILCAWRRLPKKIDGSYSSKPAVQDATLAPRHYKAGFPTT